MKDESRSRMSPVRLRSKSVVGSDLDHLAAIVNETARRSSTQWLFLVTICVYIALSAFGTNDRSLLLETPVVLPIFLVSVPIINFFWLAPGIIVVVHFYCIIQIKILADSVSYYVISCELRSENYQQRTFALRYLSTVPEVKLLVSNHVGAVDVFALFIRTITTVMLPLAVLVLLQSKFLPAQNELIMWWYRALLVIDMVILFFLLPGVVFRRFAARLAWRAASAACKIIVIFISFFVLTVPGERIELRPYSDFVRSFLKLDSDFHEYERIAQRGCQLGREAEPMGIRSFFPRAINVSGETFLSDDERRAFSGSLAVASEVHEQTRRFRDRQLRFASFNDADLRHVSFVGANLQGSTFSGAKLAGANFSQANLVGSWFCNADIQGANFTGANLQNALISWVQAQGSNFRGASLDGVFIYGTDFTGAILAGASLIASVLDDVSFQGALLAHVDLQASVLSGGVRLDAADLSAARVWLTASRRALTLAPSTNMSDVSTEEQLPRPPQLLVQERSRRGPPFLMAWAEWFDIIALQSLPYRRWSLENSRRAATSKSWASITDNNGSAFVSAFGYDKDSYQFDSRAAALELRRVICDISQSPYVIRSVVNQISPPGDFYISRFLHDAEVETVQYMLSSNTCPGSIYLRALDKFQLEMTLFYRSREN